jgi:CheY-like chemotaxis protein
MRETTLPVIGDPLRFERILTNLLSNAIRYTEKGSVTVDAEINAEGLDPEKIMLHVRVIDTGIGIPKEKQAQVFEKFIQADTSDTRRYGGTGLGLTITKELVELMNGQIGLESEVGKGTTFWFTIPFVLANAIADEDHQTQKKTDTRDFEGAIPVEDVRILIAEDHEMNQVFMQKLFKNLGIKHYAIANNGREAVEILSAQNFDLVLMDCHMPEMNGYDATEAIRNLPDSVTSEIPIIAMTANAMAKDQERCLAIGMNDYLSKPFEISEFKRKLSPWVQFPVVEDGVNGIGSSNEIPANMELLNASSMGDKGYIQTMLELFVSTAAEQIEILAAHCHDGVSQEWMETAHSLKGTAGVVGASRMLRLAAEAQAMENATATARKEKCANLQAEYDKVKKYLIRQGYYNENLH